MTIIYALVIFTCFIQIAFYTFIFLKFIQHKFPKPDILNQLNEQPISVIICAKNEYTNLEQNLPKIMMQDYYNFEVIVIDDASTDKTQLLLQKLENKYSNLLSFRIEPEDKTHEGKKQALQYGIGLAKNQFIVVTDADCLPASDKWLSLMVEPMQKDADIVLGVSPYYATKGIVNSFFRFETWSVALQYINFTLSGVPFMGVGRNMAYKKSVFEKYDIHKHWDLISGDDDLFINAVGSQHKVAIVANPKAFTYSDAPKSLKKWFKQKLRHYSTGYHYDLIQKVWLAYYWSSSLLLYCFAITLSILLTFSIQFHPFLLVITLGTLILRWSVKVISLKKLGDNESKLHLPLLDFFYILSVWIISPLSSLAKTKWK